MAVLAESIHPALWRASQLAQGRGRVLDTGFPALSREMPGGGWPLGALVDLLVQQHGVGELRLLRPALAQLGKQPVALLQPPHDVNIAGIAYIGLAPERLMRVNAPTSTDSLWAAEQILRAGTCGALLYWNQHVQSSSLRRLHLTAQASNTLFVMVRPLSSARDASPAALRLSLQPTEDGVLVDIIKRRGPSLPEPIAVTLEPSPILLSRHGRQRRATAPDIEIVTPAREDAHA
jgi:protein ImuA